jgi:hypothetical protein
MVITKLMMLTGVTVTSTTFTSTNVANVDALYAAIQLLF